MNKTIDKYLNSLKEHEFEDAIRYCDEILELEKDDKDLSPKERVFKHYSDAEKDSSIEYTILVTYEYVFNNKDLLNYALEYFNKVLDENSNDPFIISSKAYIYILLAEFDKAEKTYKQSLKTKTTPYTLIFYGVLLKDNALQYYDDEVKEKKLLHKALKIFKNTLKYENDKLMAYYYIGEVYYSLFDNEKSLEYHLKAKNNGIKKSKINHSLKNDYESLKDYDNAIKYCDLLLEEEPDDFDYQLDKIELLIKKEEYEHALELFNKLPEIPEEYYNITPISYFEFELLLNTEKDKNPKEIIDEIINNEKYSNEEIKELKKELEYEEYYNLSSYLGEKLLEEDGNNAK